MLNRTGRFAVLAICLLMSLAIAGILTLAFHWGSDLLVGHHLSSGIANSASQRADGTKDLAWDFAMFWVPCLVVAVLFWGIWQRWAREQRHQ